MKVIFISKTFNQIQNDGGAVVTKRNYNLLKKVFGENNVKLFEIPTPSKLLKFLEMLGLRDYGITKKIEKEIKKEIKVNEYDYIIFNSSLYGNLIKYCYQMKRNTCVFFHNIEKNYYYDMYKYNNNILSWLFYKYINVIERKSCVYSDCKIVLNERDSDEMYKSYSIKADLILPISMESKIRKLENKSSHNNCGFIGSDFFANKEGLLWFIQKVAPFINREIFIAGSICNFLNDKVDHLKNVKLLGYVDDLKDFYNSVDFIVSPIFHGSGMKTKSVEALSYNLPIIGTTEAFVGIVFNEIGELCNNEDDFISRINNFNLKKYQNKPYIYFEENLSNTVIEKRFSNYIFNKSKEKLHK